MKAEVRKMSKHTPGPWTLGDENNECCDVVLGTEHNLTCNFNRQDNNTSQYVISRDEMLANAHLVMAAPVMLEALKSIREFYAVKGFAELSKLDEVIKLAEGDE
jgi:hypothetical protein